MADEHHLLDAWVAAVRLDVFVRHARLFGVEAEGALDDAFDQVSEDPPGLIVHALDRSSECLGELVQVLLQRVACDTAAIQEDPALRVEKVLARNDGFIWWRFRGDETWALKRRAYNPDENCAGGDCQSTCGSRQQDERGQCYQQEEDGDDTCDCEGNEAEEVRVPHEELMARIGGPKWREDARE